MNILELKNIRKAYFLGKEEFPVLKGINLDFYRGEFISLHGDLEEKQIKKEFTSY